TRAEARWLLGDPTAPVPERQASRSWPVSWRLRMTHRGCPLRDTILGKVLMFSDNPADHRLPCREACEDTAPGRASHDEATFDVPLTFSAGKVFLPATANVELPKNGVECTRNMFVCPVRRTGQGPKRSASPPGMNPRGLRRAKAQNRSTRMRRERS